MTAERPSESPERKRFPHVDKEKLLVTAGVIFLMAHGFSAWQGTYLIEEGLRAMKDKLTKGRKGNVAHS